MSIPDRIPPRSDERAWCFDCEWTAEGVESFEAAQQHFDARAHRAVHERPLDYLGDWETA